MMLYLFCLLCCTKPTQTSMNASLQTTESISVHPYIDLPTCPTENCIFIPSAPFYELLEWNNNASDKKCYLHEDGSCRNIIRNCPDKPEENRSRTVF